MPEIVILDGYSVNPGDLSWDGIAAQGRLTVYDRTPADQIAQRIGGAECAFTNKCLITAEVLDACPNLKFIGELATGYNNIDIAAARERGVCVCNIPAYSTDSVVQMTFALLLEACHHVGAHSDAVHAGEWSSCPDFCLFCSHFQCRGIRSLRMTTGRDASGSMRPFSRISTSLYTRRLSRYVSNVLRTR